MSGQAWTVVIPVKGLTHAKSRMGETLLAPGTLAQAFLLDVLESVTASASVQEVIVATGDPVVTELAQSYGATIADDTGRPGINAAVMGAALTCAVSTPLAVVVSDLPRLTSTALDLVMAAAERNAVSFVADLEGTGTTIWLAESNAHLPPLFGTDSRAMHRAAGAVDLVEAVGESYASRILAARCDADTFADLTDPALPPLGRHTRAVLDSERARTQA